MSGEVEPGADGMPASVGPGDAGRRVGPRVGLVVNPVAGIGGRVGLKGSDGPATVRAALDRGATPQAGARAAAAVERLLARSRARGGEPTLLAGPFEMGEDAARAAGADPLVVGSIVRGTTTADDTRRVVAELLTAGVDLLLVAGGDGTARDVCAVPGIEAVPVLGIPAGVKIQSAVFATSPATAGDLAADFLALPRARRRTAPREVLDLDEDAYRRGEVAPRLWGELTVPAERRLQEKKAPTPADDAAAASGIALAIAAALPSGTRCILGPGSTLRAVADRLGVAKTLVGVDVAEMAADGTAVLLASDVAEAGLLALVTAGGDWTIVVTPIGGQGFILGRGNQQISPAIVRAVIARCGRRALVVVATPGKLGALGARPLLVDTGDAALDRELAGHIQVITGQRERAVARVAAA